VRSAVFIVGMLVLLAATTAGAQLRGGLTSRPPAPSPAPRSTISSRHLFPFWWPGIVLVPEPATRVSPRLADAAPTGGVQLDVLPWSAQVYVDGAHAGRVEEFRGYYHHLELPAGPHTIILVAGGFAPHVFDVVVVPGKIVTYRTTLR
jgi:hypothetical protein